MYLYIIVVRVKGTAVSTRYCKSSNMDSLENATVNSSVNKERL